MHHAHAPSPSDSESDQEPGATERTARQHPARTEPTQTKRPTLKDAATVAAFIAATPTHATRAPSRHAVFLLHFLERLSTKRVAAALGMSEETVMVHLRRLRLAARRWWDSETRRGGKAPTLAAGSTSPV